MKTDEELLASLVGKVAYWREHMHELPSHKQNELRILLQKAEALIEERVA